VIDPSARVHPTADVEEGAEIGAGCRVWHYAQVRKGARLGANCVVGRQAFIDFDVPVGENCKIQNNALVYHGASLGRGVFIGPAAVITNDHNPRAVNPEGGQLGVDDWQLSRVEIGDGASVGAGAVLVAGIKVGSWALIGAGAVVTKDVPPHALVVGVPARQIGWACRCGHRLDGTGALLRCGRCGREERVGVG
jgi:UDP-2-acetamido-3-amino-2,3-dideoxy-glucuronate N-acetyltransferase